MMRSNLITQKQCHEFMIQSLNAKVFFFLSKQKLKHCIKTFKNAQNIMQITKIALIIQYLSNLTLVKSRQLDLKSQISVLWRIFGSCNA